MINPQKTLDKLFSYGLANGLISIREYEVIKNWLFELSVKVTLTMEERNLLKNIEKHGNIILEDDKETVKKLIDLGFLRIVNGVYEVVK